MFAGPDDASDSLTRIVTALERIATSLEVLIARGKDSPPGDTFSFTQFRQRVRDTTRASPTGGGRGPDAA